jgi:hypothetical protein
MNKKQTAIDWLVKKISNEMIGEIPMHRWDEIRDVVQQAKAMEKKQIIDAFGIGCQVEATRLIGYHGMAEQLYRETYGE